MSQAQKDASFAFASRYLQKTIWVANDLQSQLTSIAEAISMIYDCRERGGTVFVIGNGGSASTATHFAADLTKTVTSKPGERGVKAVTLSDNIPLSSALVNDWGWSALYDAQLSTYFKEGDMLVAFSVHGGGGADRALAWSENITRAIKFVKEKGGKTIGFAGFDGGDMKTLADLCIVVPSYEASQVESYHLSLAHLITFRLKEILTEEGGAR